MVRPVRLGAALFAVLLAASPALAQRPMDSPQAAVQAALADYRRDPKSGVAGLLAIPVSTLTEVVDELSRNGLRAGDYGDLERAAIALADAAASVPVKDERFTQLWQLSNRLGLVLVKAGDTSPALRAWCLLVDAIGEDIHEYATLEPLLSDLRGTFKKDPEMLLVSGSLFETLSSEAGLVSFSIDLGAAAAKSLKTVGFSTAPPQLTVTADRKTFLTQARNFYRDALAVAPSHAEARLRLARVLHLLGDTTEALAALDALPVRTMPQEFVYLSRLFRAGIEQDLGHHDRARSAYLSAMEWHAQAPFVGLAALLRSEGDAAGAAAVTRRLLSDPPDFDPWWSYLRGQGWHLSERLNAARAAVR